MSDKKIFGFSRNVFAAGLVSLFMDISSEMIYPILPIFLTTVLGASKATVGIIEGIAESTASVLKVFSGWLSDKMGKRKFLMGIGYGVSVLSRPIMATSASWGEVLTARFVDRFGKGVRAAPRDAIIADSVENNNLGKAFGFHRSMDTIGAVIGPAIAFLVLALYLNNFRLVFWLSVIPGIISVLLIIFFITEKAHKREATAIPKLTIKDFNGNFRFYILVIFIFSIGNSSDAFLILRAENVGVPKEFIPIIYLIFNLVYSLSSTPLGMLADKLGMKRMILFSFLFYAGIYAGLAFVANQYQILGLFILYGLFKGMSEGTQRAYLASLAPPERKATAFGIYHMAVGFALLPASIIAGALWDKVGPEATFLYGTVTALLAFILFGMKKK
ncbi:MAG: MFS transporter [Deltaproteobacteria bacterium RIFCSPLOWO2_01_FULL_42_9]|nr:MAG: MFS transporter [Deltaproteobacteria bacterium RIFCSPLOWO2_01_FULL_42_9]